ncbi:sialidase [Pedobacter ginsengisoli]|uniref:Sialidase n=2 Tax=Pedobacter ginsengisoli TaxID=363852 RepID=A0A2D1UC70_9SPHI|nr:sialidase [Pedobacter ginsengisoli]
MVRSFLTVFIWTISVAIAFGQQVWKKTTDELIFNNPPFEQCHASTLVEIDGGKLMAAWFGGSHEGSKDVRIWLSVNEHGKWTSPVAVADGKVNGEWSYPLWNPVLFKTKKGRIFLFYKEGPSPREWWGMVQTSDDNGKTWSAKSRLPEGVLGPIKNKPIELADGTILSPSSTETDEKWSVHIEKSTDGGKTWVIIPVDPDSKFDVIQPSILVYGGKKLQILCRSKQGAVVESWSDDNGKTWGKLNATTLMNPNSGTDAQTLKNGTHMIVYNPTVPGKEWFNGRYKLNVALSEDGKNWADILKLEDGDTKKEFSYPAIIQSKDGKVHITYTFDRRNIKHVVLQQVKK